MMFSLPRSIFADSSQLSTPNNGAIGPTEVRMSVRRDLFASKDTEVSSSPSSSRDNDGSVLAKVVFIASGNSPNVKTINVQTSVFPGAETNIPFMMLPTTTKREKLTPNKVKTEIMTNSSPRSANGGKKISPGRRKKYTVQSNKLTNYFTPSPPKKPKLECNQSPEVIVISEDSEDEEFVKLAVDGFKSDVINLLDESGNISVVNIVDTINIPGKKPDDTDVVFVSHTLPVASSMVQTSHSPRKRQEKSSVAQTSNSTKEIMSINTDVINISSIELDDSDVQFVSEILPFVPTIVTAHTLKNGIDNSDNSPLLEPKTLPSSTQVDSSKNGTLAGVEDSDSEDDSDDFLTDTIDGIRPLSLYQLCRYFRCKQLDVEDVANRLNVKYSTDAAEYEAWLLSGDEAEVIAAEIKLKNWHLALNDCLNFTDDYTFLPSYILQHVMHNALHSHDVDCVSLSCNVLHKMLRLHPAYANYMHEYYQKLLTDTYLMNSAAYPRSNVSILDQVLKLVSDLSANRNYSITSAVNITNCPENMAYQQLEAMERARQANNVYSTLSGSDKMERVCLLLEYVVMVLETDMVGCDKQSRLSLITQLFWPKCARRTIGVSNAKCREVFQLLRLTLEMPVNMYLVRLVSVMAEAVLVSSANDCEISKPYNNKKCSEFARNIFLAISSTGSDLAVLVPRLKPGWLQALILDVAAPMAQLK